MHKKCILQEFSKPIKPIQPTSKLYIEVYCIAKGAISTVDKDTLTFEVGIENHSTN